MADALKTFKEGEDILASETNGNNQYLLSRLSDNAAQVQSYVEGEVATIKSNVASVQATLQNEIDEIAAQVHLVETIVSGNYWRRVYSDGWCEQGDITSVGGDSSKTVTLQVPYKNTAYHIQATSRSAFKLGEDAGVGAYPSSSGTFTLRNGADITSNICWRASGYINRGG